MIDANGARKYRVAAETEARVAAAAGDREVWLRAIGRIVAIDYCLSDEEDLAPASERIPFGQALEDYDESGEDKNGDETTLVSVLKELSTIDAKNTAIRELLVAKGIFTEAEFLDRFQDAWLRLMRETETGGPQVP